MASTEKTTLRLRRAAVLAAPLAFAAALLALTPGQASAGSFVPPNGKLFHGVSETGDTADFRRFTDQVRAHPAVTQNFFHWGVPLTSGALYRWQQTESRGVLSLQTGPGGQPEVISPRDIALGRGDDYIVRLNKSIASSRQVVYIRLMAEMNGHWNPYSAYNADGSSRGADHTQKWYRKAWRRFALIVRGGMRATINKKLKREHLPRILRANSEKDPIYPREHVRKHLAKPKVALMWVPQTIGSPNIPGNDPKRYWPGGRYVDWVGADAYAKYSNATLWRALNAFYRRYNDHPFVIGEYSPWDNDRRGAFVKRLFRWARQHARTRMLIYYRSVNPWNRFNIQFYPGAQDTLIDELNSPLFTPKAPEYLRKKKKHH